jgi:hypothetical protein
MARVGIGGGSSGSSSLELRGYGSRALDTIIEDLLGAATYDRMTSTKVGDVETLRFFSSSVEQVRLQITWLNATDWEITTVSLVDFFLLLESGDFLLQENGDKFILE